MQTYDPEMTWQNEPDREMFSLNPFVQARNTGGWRQSDLSEAVGVPSLRIMRLEQGVLQTVPPNILAWYKKNLDLPNNWKERYMGFQTAVRKSAPRPIYGAAVFPGGRRTFSRWRNYNWPNLSLMAWSKCFCIHPSSVWRIEQSDFNGLIPVAIQSALIEAGIYDAAKMITFVRAIREDK